MGPPAHSQENLNPPRPPALTLAQRSNLSSLTARGYMAWRTRSLSLLAREPLGLSREARLFLGACRPRPGEQWLDAGTSAGYYAGLLAARGCRVLAADLSAPMLREGARREGSALIDWALLNLEASGLPDGAFDGVTVGATLNETRDPARFLGELARLTRPGGQLWLMYLRRTGGPLQTLLSAPALGGLTFPDPAWVGRALPEFQRTLGAAFGPVHFERYVKASVPTA